MLFEVSSSKPNAKRQVGFTAKKANVLRSAVFDHLEIVRGPDR